MVYLEVDKCQERKKNKEKSFSESSGQCEGHKSTECACKIITFVINLEKRQNKDTADINLLKSLTLIWIEQTDICFDIKRFIAVGSIKYVISNEPDSCNYAAIIVINDLLRYTKALLK